MPGGGVNPTSNSIGEGGVVAAADGSRMASYSQSRCFSGGAVMPLPGAAISRTPRRAGCSASLYASHRF